MRNYNDWPNTRRFLLSHRNTFAVCPFPGKHPLRLHWEVTEADGKFSDSYCGKLTAGAWKHLVRLAGRNEPVFCCVDIFDKYRMVASGESPHTVSFMNPLSSKRYLYGMDLQRQGGGMYWRSEDFATLRPVRVGPYWMYAAERTPIDPRKHKQLVQDIAHTVPTLRTC